MARHERLVHGITSTIKPKVVPSNWKTFGTRHRFAVGDLVLFDEVLAAIILQRNLSWGVPLYDLRTEAGIERNVVEGYVQEWPIDMGAPFRPIPRQARQRPLVAATLNEARETLERASKLGDQR